MRCGYPTSAPLRRVSRGCGIGCVPLVPKLQLGNAPVLEAPASCIRCGGTKPELRRIVRAQAGAWARGGIGSVRRLHPRPMNGYLVGALFCLFATIVYALPLFAPSLRSGWRWGEGNNDGLPMSLFGHASWAVVFLAALSPSVPRDSITHQSPETPGTLFSPRLGLLLLQTSLTASSIAKNETCNA